MSSEIWAGQRLGSRERRLCRRLSNCQLPPPSPLALAPVHDSGTRLDRKRHHKRSIVCRQPIQPPYSARGAPSFFYSALWGAQSHLHTWTIPNPSPALGSTINACTFLPAPASRGAALARSLFNQETDWPTHVNPFPPRINRTQRLGGKRRRGRHSSSRREAATAAASGSPGKIIGGGRARSKRSSDTSS